MQATVAGRLGRELLHARIDETPPGEFHRHDRPAGKGPEA